MKKIHGLIGVVITLILAIAYVRVADRASLAGAISESTFTPSPAILNGSPIPEPDLVLVEFFAGF